MPSPTCEPLVPREQRVLDALRALAPPDSRRVVVSINDLASRLGMQPGEASRAVIKLWLLRRIRGYQEPRGADPSEFEIVDDDPNTNTSESEQPALLSVSANTNTTSETVPSPAPAVVPAASTPEGGRGEPTEGGGGEVPNESNGSDRDARTSESNESFSLKISKDSGRIGLNDSTRNESSRAREGGLVPIGAVIADRVQQLDDMAARAPTQDGDDTTETTAPRTAAEHAQGALETTAELQRAPSNDSGAEPPSVAIARECAEKLGDAKNLTVYLVLASRYSEEQIRRALGIVLAVPAEDIRRSRGALFTHILKHPS